MGEYIEYWCDICKKEIEEGEIWDIQMDKKQVSVDQHERSHSETIRKRFLILCEEHYKKIAELIKDEKMKGNAKRREAEKKKREARPEPTEEEPPDTSPNMWQAECPHCKTIITASTDTECIRCPECRKEIKIRRENGESNPLLL